MNSKALLELLSQRLFIGHHLKIVSAAELEFYLHGMDEKAATELLGEFSAQAAAQQIPLEKTEKERGDGQYEIALRPDSPIATADAVARCKVLLDTLADAKGGEADFSAKPKPDQPPSGLHFHLHLQNEEGENIYSKNGDVLSPPLSQSLAGLLALMSETMLAFAPDEASYARFTPKGQTPTTVSWGGNNRTVALRLPDSGAQKRIEHRVAGADANPYLALAAIIAGIIYGLDCALPLSSPQIYGDATLPSYGLAPLPHSKAQARAALTQAVILPRVFPELLTPLQES